MNYGALIFIMILAFFGSLFLFGYAKELTELKSRIFVDKELPIAKTVKIGKRTKFNVKFYNLKKTDKGEIDRHNYYYLVISQIINKHLTFELSQDLQSVDAVMGNFKSEELRTDYEDIIEVLTNFKLRQFVFKADSKYKNLFDVSNDLINSMKSHADEIIQEVFVELVSTIEESMEVEEE